MTMSAVYPPFKIEKQTIIYEILVAQVTHITYTHTFN